MKKKINIRGGLPFTNFDEITSVEIAASFLSGESVNADGFGVTKPLNVRLDCTGTIFVCMLLNANFVLSLRDI
ncbi:hypothetical protein, partial [Kingella kingae]|uniref:hypothetical protein n=1 Tax=Kingella kingae TaxID=504 RepID=UPI00254A268D